MENYRFQTKRVPSLLQNKEVVFGDSKTNENVRVHVERASVSYIVIPERAMTRIFARISKRNGMNLQH